MMRRSQRGMTLPEVLVALLMFSAIAATSVQALRLGVESRDQLEAMNARMKSEQLSRLLIKEDLAQIVLRTVRDEFGTTNTAPFRGNLTRYGGSAADDETTLAAFVRRGWINPEAESPRSALQYVEYIFRDGVLIRRARIYPDGAPGADVMERELFTGLDQVRAAFLVGEARGELQWADIWPTGGASLPKALSLTFERNGAPPLTQLFWIGEIGAGP